MPRPTGSKNKLGPTPALSKLYRLFVRPFLDHFTLPEGEDEHEAGVEAFFNVPGRSVAFCRARESFTIPGSMWADQSQPNRIIPGVEGRRYVVKGQAFVLRVDERMPDRSEIEFEEQVFILTRAQLMFIRDKIEVVA